MKYMEPVVAPLVTEVCFTLCNFVGVVGECVVNTAAVNVKVTAKMLYADSGTLNVPTGVTVTPGAVPLKLLVVKLGLCKP